MFRLAIRSRLMRRFGQPGSCEEFKVQLGDRSTSGDCGRSGHGPHSSGASMDLGSRHTRPHKQLENLGSQTITLSWQKTTLYNIWRIITRRVNFTSIHDTVRFTLGVGGHGI